MSNLTAENNRYYNIDLLRILCSFFVIIIHTYGRMIGPNFVLSFTWILQFFVMSNIVTAVPLFIIISGYLTSEISYSPYRLFKKILKLFFIFLFSSTFYCIYSICIHGFEISDLKIYLGSIFCGYYHLWFLPVLIGVFICQPFLYVILKEKKEIYAIVLGIILICILPITIKFLSIYNTETSVGLITLFENISVGSGLSIYCVYYLIGSVMKHKSPNATTSVLLIFIGGIISTILSAFFSTKSSSLITFWANSDIGVTISAIGIIGLFCNIRIVKYGFLYKTVSFFSKCSLGVYIIHPLIIETFSSLGYFTFINKYTVIAYCFIVLLVSYLFIGIIVFIKEYIKKTKKCKETKENV